MQTQSTPYATNGASRPPVVAPNGEIAFTPRELKALATTRKNGDTLLADGYTIHVEPKPGVYLVQSPVRVRQGEAYSTIYTVDVCGGTCECEAFARLGECKHQIAVTKAVAEAVALLAPMIPAPVAAVVARPAAPIRSPFTSRAAFERAVDLDFA